MTDIEDQLRAYSAGVARSQQPVAVGEVIARRRGRGPRRVVLEVAAALAAVALVAGVIVANRDHTTRVVVAPETTPTSVRSESSVSTPVVPHDCPAAKLSVASSSGELLHPDWLPAGFVLKEGNEREPGGVGSLMYSTPGNGDHPYVEMARHNSQLPVNQLISGASRPIFVNDLKGIVSNGLPDPRWTLIAWRVAPTTALVVTGYQIPEADLLRIAESVQYESGAPFTYPADPKVTVTREEALAKLRGSSEDAHVVLTSFGEIDAVISSDGRFNRIPRLASNISVTQPVWVVWRPGDFAAPLADSQRASVIDAQTGKVITIAVDPSALSSLTDRSKPTCSPPFGVLTRSEVAHLRRAEPGTTMTLKLTTLGALYATPTFSSQLGQCTIQACDPTAPTWLIVQSAPNSRFDFRNGSPRGGTPVTQAGSWMASAIDARTGPQSSGPSGAVSGTGPPPADVLTVDDLAPVS